jgi:hypothetical protein
LAYCHFCGEPVAVRTQPLLDERIPPMPLGSRFWTLLPGIRPTRGVTVRELLSWAWDNQRQISWPKPEVANDAYSH